MQSRDYSDLLKEIHGDSIDKWYVSEEDMNKERDMGGETILEFIKREVWQDVDSRKWIFKGKQFKRKGQAETAAFRNFKSNK